MQQQGVQKAASTPCAKGRVLVVDDEPLMGTTLRVALGEEHDVVVVGSGQAACRLLESDDAFDAIICDLMMPDVSGMELYRWLEANAPRIARRIIFMTGGAYTDRARQFLANVHNPRVQKPFDVDQLLDMVRSLCRETR